MANILVCDDDKDIVEAIGIYLEQEGYTVIKAYDGVEAINVLRSQPVDLLIIDIMMPKLDGIASFSTDSLFMYPFFSISCKILVTDEREIENSLSRFFWKISLS